MASLVVEQPLVQQEPPVSDSKEPWIYPSAPSPQSRDILFLLWSQHIPQFRQSTRGDRPRHFRYRRYRINIHQFLHSWSVLFLTFPTFQTDNTTKFTPNTLPTSPRCCFDSFFRRHRPARLLFIRRRGVCYFQLTHSIFESKFRRGSFIFRWRGWSRIEDRRSTSDGGGGRSNLRSSEC